MKTAVLCSALLALLSVLPISATAVEPATKATRALAALAAADRVYGTLLREHVSEGLVDYARLRHDPQLADYLAQLARIDPSVLPRTHELAFWLNLYNAATLKLVADHYPVRSIFDLARGGRWLSFVIKGTPWDIRFVETAGGRLTLNQIEHERVRERFSDEPRIHFALVCAALSCPPLLDEPYAAERLEDQLARQTRTFLADTRHNRFDMTSRTATISAIFKWYGDDFGRGREALGRFLARWAPEPAASALAAAPGNWRIEFAEYDWSLNDASPGDPLSRRLPPRAPR